MKTSIWLKHIRPNVLYHPSYHIYQYSPVVGRAMRLLLMNIHLSWNLKDSRDRPAISKGLVCYAVVTTSTCYCGESELLLIINADVV